MKYQKALGDPATKSGDNFGSLVQIPFSSIFQIIKNDNIVFINISATLENINQNPKNKSMNIFKNNPNNSKFN